MFYFKFNGIDAFNDRLTLNYLVRGHRLYSRMWSWRIMLASFHCYDFQPHMNTRRGAQLVPMGIPIVFSIVDNHGATNQYFKNSKTFWFFFYQRLVFGLKIVSQWLPSFNWPLFGW